MFPRPTAEPAQARMYPHLVPHCSRCVSLLMLISLLLKLGLDYLKTDLKAHSTGYSLCLPSARTPPSLYLINLMEL